MQWEKFKANLANAVASQHYKPTEKMLAAFCVSAETLETRTVKASAEMSSNEKKLADAIRERIMNWDIRCVPQLIALFEEHVPKKFRNVTINCIFVNDNWHIEPLT